MLKELSCGQCMRLQAWFNKSKLLCLQFFAVCCNIKSPWEALYVESKPSPSQKEAMNPGLTLYGLPVAIFWYKRQLLTLSTVQLATVSGYGTARFSVPPCNVRKNGACVLHKALLFCALVDRATAEWIFYLKNTAAIICKPCQGWLHIDTVRCAYEHFLVASTKLSRDGRAAISSNKEFDSLIAWGRKRIFEYVEHKSILFKSSCMILILSCMIFQSVCFRCNLQWLEVGLFQ